MSYEDAPESGFGTDALTADQALARARRALEESEEVVRGLAQALGDAATVDEQIQLADSLAYIGGRWTELGGELRRAER